MGMTQQAGWDGGPSTVFPNGLGNGKGMKWNDQGRVGNAMRTGTEKGMGMGVSRYPKLDLAYPPAIPHLYTCIQ